ncbi:MAG: serine/threonine-protein kinase [Fuerstiella sp.]
MIDEYEMRLEDGEEVSAADICRGHTELIPAFLARLDEVTAANATLSALAQSASQPEVPGYRILSELGRGGSAIVYRAIQLEMDREVAVKVFFPQLLDRLFFRREIAVIKRLTHDGIPAIFDCGRLNFGNAELCWFSMELLKGGTIDRRTVCERSTTEILQLFRKTVEAVHYAHLNGVLHRDIKSSNILLDEKGSPHVADFGIAKLLEEDQESLKRSTVGHMGTPAYTAPELILGHREQPDIRTEVYSLGVLLFEMLTGQHPFGENAEALAGLRKTLTSQTVPSPKLLRPDVSVDLETFVLSLLSIDPRDRYESCVIVLDELQRLLNGQPIAARRVGAFERAYRWCRVHYLTAAATLAATAVVLVLLVQLNDRQPCSHLLDTSPKFPLEQFGTAVRTLQPGQSGRVLICHREGWFSTVEVAQDPFFKRVCLVAAFNWIVSGSHDGWLRRHDAVTGKVFSAWRAHDAGINAIAVDHERAIIYTASRNGEIRSWGLDGTPRRKYVGHYDRIHALALSRDGTTLASGGDDHDVIIWDAVSGEQQLVLEDHAGPVLDLFFGEDGLLYSTSQDHTVRVWGIDYTTTGTPH